MKVYNLIVQLIKILVIFAKVYDRQILYFLIKFKISN